MKAAVLSIEALLATYPRQRSPLTAAHQALYDTEYKANRDGANAVSGIAQKLERWMHRQIARRQGPDTLELGAGTLNHLPYEPRTERYDVIEPMQMLWQDSPHRSRVRNIYASSAEMPEPARYGRVISVAVLEHLTDLPAELARAVLHLQPDGVLQAGIPSEGGFLWGLAWRATTGIAYRLRTGLDYGTLMRHEHVNRADEILRVLRHLFDDVRVARFPTPLHHLSFYTAIEAHGPRIDRARALLQPK